MGIKVVFRGDYALFSRPELHVERYSYPIPTPTACRGMIESIYYHPGLRWHIDSITVLNEIKYTSVRRNEVKSKLLASTALEAMKNPAKRLAIYTGNDIQQRAATVLMDVRYVVEAHFEMTEKAASTDSEEKFYAIVSRRLQKGQCYSQPYLGCREFSASFIPWTKSESESFYKDKGTEDFGLVLYDLDYSDTSDITPMFFRAVMNDGVIKTSGAEVYR